MIKQVGLMKTEFAYNMVLTGLAFLALAGCTRIDDDLSGEKDRIQFGASTSWQNEEETRTEYSGTFNTLTDGRYERIDWVSGTDRIRIFSPQAYGGGANTAGTASDYTITTPVSSSGEKSIAYITSVTENSLRWGSSNTHYFYGLYPAPATKWKYNNSVVVGNNDVSITGGSDNKAVITGTVPATQVVKWNANQKEYEPNMNYAYMYAATSVSTRSSVTLSFKPLVTTLRFQIKAKDADVAGLTLTGFKLSSSSKNLSGPFKATVSPTSCTIENGSGTFTKNVSVSIPSDEQQQLSTSSTITVTLFTLAVETITGLYIELTLRNSSNQTVTRKLDLKSGSSDITVAPRCKTYINSLSIPGGLSTITVTYPVWTPVTSGSGNTYGPVGNYTTSDSFGIYAYNSSGTRVLNNVQLTASSVNTSTRVATLNVPTGEFWSKNWTYYIYYPYTSSPGTVSSTLTNSSTTADTFFTNVISGWTVETTQNQTTLANYKKSDLQVGKLSGTAFSMTHAMGLAKMNIVNKTAPETITKTFNSTGANPSSTTNSSTNVTLTTSTSLTTATANRMYKDGSNNYWTIVKPSTSTNVTLSSNSGNDAWTLTFSGITSGKYKAANAITARECKNYVLNYNYTGDVKALTIPLTGTYEFFVWGAQGQSTTALTGTNNNGTYRGGYGGYSHGKMSLTKGNIIYIIVGQTGASGTNNYAWPNGGGSGSSGNASSVGTGGGASLITDKSGGVTISGRTSLQSLAASDILIMAGGGGAACWGQHSGSNYWTGHGGAGGGYMGYAGTTNTHYSTAGKGGTQSAGGAAGGVSGRPAGERLAGGGASSPTCTGGGGGFYGGGSSWGSAGGGGSGYIGNSKLTTDKYMYSYYNSAYTSDSEHTSSATDTKTYSTTNVSSASPPAQSASARQGNGYIIIKSGL